MHRRMPVSKPSFSAVSMLGLRGAVALALVDERRERRILRRRRRRQRMIRRERHELRAEQRVRPRGEDLQLALAARRRLPDRARSAPAGPRSGRSSSSASARTFSGQRSSVSSASSRSCEKSVILKNHCVSSRCSTSAPERQPRPSITCSLASTVMSTGSQFTFDCLRSTSPAREEVEEHLLLVLVVGRIAGRDLARPVERQPHRLELRLHGGDVLVGPARGWTLRSMAAFSAGMPKASQPIGCSTLKPRRALVARHHVAHRVVAHVAHVDAPRRIGEHLQHVVFRPRVVVARGEDVRARPRSSASGPRPRGRCSGRICFDSGGICGPSIARG